MKLTITPKAQEWFKKELKLADGQGIKFYGKVYGKTQVHDGFSVGMSVDTPESPLVKTKERISSFILKNPTNGFSKVMIWWLITILNWTNQSMILSKFRSGSNDISDCSLF